MMQKHMNVCPKNVQTFAQNLKNLYRFASNFANVSQNLRILSGLKTCIDFNSLQFANISDPVPLLRWWWCVCTLSTCSFERGEKVPRPCIIIPHYAWFTLRTKTFWCSSTARVNSGKCCTTLWQFALLQMAHKISFDTRFFSTHHDNRRCEQYSCSQQPIYGMREWRVFLFAYKTVENCVVYIFIKFGTLIS